MAKKKLLISLVALVLERPLFLRIGAVSIILGVIVSSVSELFHGGHQPHDLVVTLPQYAANANWIVVHLVQFLGRLLVVGGLVGLILRWTPKTRQVAKRESRS